MLQFTNTAILWLLGMVPPAILLYLFYQQWRKRNLRAIASDETITVLVKGYDRHRHLVKFVLQLVAFSLLVLAAAGPRVKSAGKKQIVTGGDVMVCMDISSSMLAEDLKPNRLTMARQAASSLFRLLDREQVGLILYAGEAYIQVPLTIDKAVAGMLLNSSGPTTAGNQGTALGDAISLSVRAFGSDEVKQGRTIVIISDGEDHEGGVVEEAKIAGSKNIKIFALGLGNPSGVPIPLYTNGVLTGYKKDREGNTVITSLRPEVLAEAAEITGGELYVTDNMNAAVRKIVEAIRSEGVAQRKVDDNKAYVLQFRWFAGLALLLLGIDLFLTLRRNRKSFYDRLSGAFRAGLVLVFLMIPALMQSQSIDRQRMRSGNRAYEKGDYEKAAELYRNSIRKDKTHPLVDHNLGTALYRNHQYKDAYGHLRAASENNLDSLSKSRIYYNLGNAALKTWQQMKDQGQGEDGVMLREGIRAFSQALRFNPDNEDARYNLTKALQWLHQDQKQEQNNTRKDNLQQDRQKQEQPLPENRKDEDRDQQQEKPRPEGTITREDAERILNAIREKEMKTAEQIQERERKKGEMLRNKDW